ncbi:hypothetical protein GQ457_12G018500 [Hibiscus cannabinus]
MGCLYSFFDVKKKGKSVWVVRARNWKLRGGENRLSRLLEGVSVNNRSGSKQVGFKNRSGSKQVGFGCYSNMSDSVSGQHQSVTDQVRVITASGQTRF